MDVLYLLIYALSTTWIYHIIYICKHHSQKRTKKRDCEMFEERRKKKTHNNIYLFLICPILLKSWARNRKTDILLIGRLCVHYTTNFYCIYYHTTYVHCIFKFCCVNAFREKWDTENKKNIFQTIWKLK